MNIWLFFAREHFWKNVLWSEESKFYRVRSDGKRYVRRPPNMLHNPKQYDGEYVMVWAAFSGHGVGHICKINTRMVYSDTKYNDA